MAIEKLLTDLIAAVEANTAAIQGGASAETPAKKAAPAKSAPAKKAPAKKAPAKKAAITVDVIAKRFGEYLKTGSKDDREAAKANVTALIAHFDTDRLTNLDPESFEDALAFLDQFEAGEDPFGEEEEGEDDGSDLM